MTLDVIREIAKEFRYEEIIPETEGWYSFRRKIAKGQIRINYWPQAELMWLIITKDQKGFHNYRKIHPTNKYRLVYEAFKHPNKFRKIELK
jgi:hypothetical protein